MKEIQIINYIREIIASDELFQENLTVTNKSYIVKDLNLDYFFDDYLGEFYHKISNKLNIEITVDDFLCIEEISSIDDVDNYDTNIENLARSLMKIVDVKNNLASDRVNKFVELLEGKTHKYWVSKLISSKTLYEKSALGSWTERYNSKFLAALSVMRSKFPDNCEEFCDYIFSTSQISFGDLEAIYLEHIVNKTLNRKASMIGGFLWTDSKNPWPGFDPDSKTGALTPIAQVNLNEVSKIAGINFPNIIIQLWGDEHIRKINIDNLENPEWNLPDFIENGYGLYKKNDHFGYAVKTHEPSVSCDVSSYTQILSNNLISDYDFDDKGNILNSEQTIELNSELFDDLYEAVAEIQNEIHGKTIFPNPNNYNDEYSSYSKEGWRILIGTYNWSIYYRLINNEYEFTSTYSPS